MKASQSNRLHGQSSYLKLLHATKRGLTASLDQDLELKVYHHVQRSNTPKQTREVTESNAGQSIQ